MKTLPAGLTTTDTRAEFFSTAPVNQGGKLKGMYQGKSYAFWDLPMKIIQVISLRFQRDRKAADTFPDDMTWKDKLEQYAICNLGGFDNIPDIDKDGNIQFEYWDCGMRGQCPHEFKRCRPDCIVKNHLSRREVDIIQTIARGKSYKETAELLFLATGTIISHMKNIKAKLNLNKESEITAWTIHNNIV